MGRICSLPKLGCLSARMLDGDECTRSLLQDALYDSDYMYNHNVI